MSDMPLLTIVIATYNCANTLQACLDSIYSQSYQRIEIIVVDGASSDDTVPIIERNSNSIAAWISEPDNGIYDAWNKALGMAKGDWLYFIGADDVLHDEDAISRAMAALERVPKGTLLAYGQVQYIGSDGRAKTVGEPWETACRQMLSQMCLPHQAVFHSRSLFEYCGDFDADLQIAGDYKLAMKSLNYAKPEFLQDVVVADQHAGGMSSLRRNRAKALLEFRRVQSELGYKVRPEWCIAYAKGLAWSAMSRFHDFGS